jgi:hypothetical protein
MAVCGAPAGTKRKMSRSVRGRVEPVEKRYMMLTSSKLPLLPAIEEGVGLETVVVDAGAGAHQRGRRISWLSVSQNALTAPERTARC